MEMKFMRRTAKYIQQDYKTNEDVLSELQKIQNYGNKWVQHVQRMNRDRLPHELWNINHVGNKAKANASKDFSTVNGAAAVHET